MFTYSLYTCTHQPKSTGDVFKTNGHNHTGLCMVHVLGHTCTCILNALLPLSELVKTIEKWLNNEEWLNNEQFIPEL